MTQNREAYVSFMSKLSLSSERLSFMPVSSVYLNFGIKKYAPTINAPRTKLG